MNPESDRSSGSETNFVVDRSESNLIQMSMEPGEYMLSIAQALYMNKIMPQGFKIESEEAINAVIEDEPELLVGRKRSIKVSV